jgi:PHP family Zn ribbon phosphoesterase
MNVGTKKYKISNVVKRWYLHQFGKYNQTCNRKCMLSKVCANRWKIIKCGECWRADRFIREAGESK